MKICLVLSSLLISFGMAKPNFSSQVTNGKKTKSIPSVDSLISRLDKERWKPDDEQCLQATLDMLWGVKNGTLWATWMWDAMQSPVGTLYGANVHIGNYDQCLQPPWSSEDSGNLGLRAQYCLVDVRSDAVEESREFGAFDDAEEYFRTPTKDRRRFNKHTFGVCLPAACSPSSVARIYRLLHQLTHLPGGEVIVDPRDCQKAGEVMEYSWGFYLFWALVAALFVTAVSSTLLNSAANDEAKPTIFASITSSFCLKSNYNSLFSINRSEVKVLNGMRAITAAVVVFIHESFYTILCPVVNGLDLNKTLNSVAGRAISHVDLVVDTFLAMSGLLLMRGLMTGRQTNLFYTLVKRYIRLIGPLGLCTLYLTTGAVMYTDHGPFWSRANREETEVCVKNWWRNVLMVNTDITTLCHVVTWYVSCDFQLSILGTCLYCVWRRNRKWGVAAFALVAAAVTLNVGFVVYSKRLTDAIPFHFETYTQLRNNTTLNLTYFKSHIRAGPYLLGMLMGYIIAVYKPDEHRNIISKKWSIITIATSLATMSAMLCLEVIFSGRPYDPLEVAVVVATNRVFWAAAVCCIIGACEYGSVPLISNLLSWPGFVPLSKLSYGLYLLHPLILQQQKLSARTLGEYKALPMIINAYGVLVIGYAASLILYLILEAPLNNMSAILNERSKYLEQNGVKEDNINNETCTSSHVNGHMKEKCA